MSIVARALPLSVVSLLIAASAAYAGGYGFMGGGCGDKDYVDHFVLKVKALTIVVVLLVLLLIFMMKRVRDLSSRVDALAKLAEADHRDADAALAEPLEVPVSADEESSSEPVADPESGDDAQR